MKLRLTRLHMLAATAFALFPQVASAYEHHIHAYWSGGRQLAAVRIYNNNNYTITCTIDTQWQYIKTYGRSVSHMNDSTQITVRPGNYGMSPGFPGAITRYNTRCRGR